MCVLYIFTVLEIKTGNFKIINSFKITMINLLHVIIICENYFSKHNCEKGGIALYIFIDLFNGLPLSASALHLLQ